MTRWGFLEERNETLVILMRLPWLAETLGCAVTTAFTWLPQNCYLNNHQP